MQFFTPVALPPSPQALTPQSQLLVIGSCFAQHMGQRLLHQLPPSQVQVNPFGVLYGEKVIHQSLERLIHRKPFEPHLYFEDTYGSWHSWAHSGAFNAQSQALCATQTESAFQAALQLLDQAQWLIITLSTDRHYRLQSAPGIVVANCHKQPAQLFVEESDALPLIETRWHELLQALHRSHPQLQVLFTLSPYRYAKYGLHENQVSKAKLLLLIEGLCASLDHCHYFPAYEIVLDELRDYRFYKPDMLHPSDQAIDHVWERFQQWIASPQWHDYASQRAALLRDLAHRPLHPDSPAHQQFLERLQARIATFESRWGCSLTSSPR